MFKKKSLLLTLVLLLTAALLVAGCGAAKDEGKKEGATKGEDKKTEGEFSVGMVSDTGGIDDESFNQTGWEGVKRAEKELGAKINFIESKRDEDYVPNLTKFARQKTDISWGIGYKFDKAIPQVAKQFKDSKFGIVDSNLGGDIPDNVVSVMFKEHEASFLVGVIAAEMTKTDKVGFIGGITSPTIQKFQVGFEAGVHAVKPDAKVIVTYAESFDDVAKGRTLAKGLFDDGADIVYHAAGGVGKGLFDEVKTRKQGEFWVIGVDMDQSHLAPDHTLTSMIKRVDVGVFEMTKALKEGDFQGGKEVQFGLKENGVGIADNSDKHVPKDVLDKVDEFEKKIVDGEIEVPATPDELKEYKAK
ncbi:BMP family lipoprotein [Numidum massiliense]|uniref:BMP family lipoprotein n=1 Tax=Numidum massiliense TaxID=1522315 RepID=UPI0006D576C7|nr:BMP family ABC transporter substrate-binding protein [Numidum massiliense]